MSDARRVCHSFVAVIYMPACVLLTLTLRLVGISRGAMVGCDVLPRSEFIWRMLSKMLLRDDSELSSD